jgi:RNA polymerase sigma factor (sigma-70 family)
MPNHSSRPPVVSRTALSDGDLLTAVRSGDERAWSELVSRYGRLITFVARRHGLSAADSADITQTTWLRLLTHAETIRSPSGLASWLTTTAKRECYAAQRRRRREVPVEVPELDQQAQPCPDEDIVESLDLARRRHRLRSALCRLPARQRDLVELLMSQESLSYKEISHRLGMPVGAIGPVRQRAMNRLRDHLAEEEALSVATGGAMSRTA